MSDRLRNAFLTELDDQVRGLNEDLLALEDAPGDPELLQATFRRFHTLKGAASAAGFAALQTFCHEREDLLATVRGEERPLTPEELQRLLEAADALEAAHGVLEAGEGPGGARLRAALRPDTEMTGAPAGPDGDAASSSSKPAGPPASATPAGSVRIEAHRLRDALTASSRVGAATEATLALEHRLRTLQRDLRNGGAGDGTAPDGSAPPERRPLRRGLSRELDSLVADFRRSTRRLSREVDDLTHRVHAMRLRPFADACQPLPRAVRDVAAGAGKEVRLAVAGESVQADRAVLDALREALLPLVRNAVDHGIEDPQERERLGKPPGGTVSVSASLEGGRIVVRVADDGRGVDVSALRDRLAREGREVPDSDDEIVRSLLEGGLTSRRRADKVSGRGVGLDIARAAMERVKGTLSLSWKEGEGTKVALRCPPSVATDRIVLCRSGSHRVGIPTASVLRVVAPKRDELVVVGGRPALPGEDGPPIPVHALGALLGSGFGAGAVQNGASFLVLQERDEGIAVAVDEVLREQEVVVRPLPRLFGRETAATGATILGTGQLALLLHVGRILRRARGASAPAVPLVETSDGADAAVGPRVLVVDDSITTRTLERTLLEREGYEVVTAPDGAEAWSFLQENPCDLVVSDIDMPGMDGFDLCRAVRSSHRLRELPVILVTALESEEDRRRGLEAGADAYLGKSGFDQDQLLETVRRFLGEDP